MANAVPKLVVHRLLRPALAADPPVQLVCRENNAELLVAELATHACDVVLTDTPAPPHVRVRVYNHLLGESGMSLFAAAPLASRLRRRFPASLHGAPMLMPTSNTPTRRALDHWLEQHALVPQVVAEFEDPALMKVFGEAGGVAFVGPTAIESEIARHYRVRPVGRIAAIRERYYAISPERRVKHPGVIAITNAARLILN